MAPSLHSLHLEGAKNLNGTNYATWKVKMESLLFFQDFWEIVSMDRTYETEDDEEFDEEALAKWDKKASPYDEGKCQQWYSQPPNGCEDS